jgi:hypothetical protein
MPAVQLLAAMNNPAARRERTHVIPDVNQQNGRHVSLPELFSGYEYCASQ